MSGKRSAILNFLKRAHKDSENAQGTDDAQGADSPLGPSRSEQWSWMGTAAGGRPRTADPKGNTRTLGAARSESWPWGAEASRVGICAEAPAEETQNSYMDVLQSASQRGYQAPPRHEVQEYQHKELPLPPPILDQASAGSSRRSSAATRSRQPTMPSTRLSMAVDSTPDESEAQIYQSELVSPQLKWQTGNHIVSDRQSAWVSRVERRAENDKKGRELLLKKQKPNVEIPEHGQ